MYRFEKRDEGFLVLDPNSRAVASVDCAKITWVNDPRLARGGEDRIEKYPKEKWQIHFTGTRFTPGEFEQMVTELLAQEF